MLCTTPFKIDKVYIITYDENMNKLWRVIIELSKIWIYEFEIIKWVNYKDIQIADFEWNWTRVYYMHEWKQHKFVLKDGVDLIEQRLPNCACMLSHKIAFKKASKWWYKTVLMVEDDLLLSYKAERYFDEILNQIPNDWDMARLEWNFARNMWEIELVNNYWFKCNNVRSTAFMLFNKRSIEHILNVMNNWPLPSFDQLTNEQCKELNSYTSLRSMWIQYPL